MRRRDQVIAPRMTSLVAALTVSVVASTAPAVAHHNETPPAASLTASALQAPVESTPIEFGPPQIIVDFADGAGHSGHWHPDGHYHGAPGSSTADADTAAIVARLTAQHLESTAATGTDPADTPAAPTVGGAVGGAVTAGGISVIYNSANPPPDFARPAIVDSVDSWNATLSTNGAPVVVEVSWVPLGGEILGYASTRLGSGGDLPAGYSYPAALANVILGSDVISGPEIHVYLNSDLHADGKWHYGADAPAGGTFDLRTVVAHEIGHGVGFVSSASNDGQPLAFTSPPSIYDAQAVYQGQPVINASNVATALTSGSVSIKVTSTKLEALYTPPQWRDGSSLSHFDLSSSSLMSPRLSSGVSNRTIDGSTAGVLKRIGWPMAFNVSGPPKVTSRALDGQIERVYLAHLRRKPDSEGFTFWLKQRAGGLSLTAMIAQFQSSAEFVRTYGSLNNTEFVRLIYNNVLGRNPDANGLAHWTGLLNGGMSRAEVTAGFIESTEFVRITGTDAPYGGDQGPVRRLYLAFFGREGATSDVTYWSGQVSGGTSLTSIADFFSTSTEFGNKYGSLTDAQYVSLVYLGVLGRNPDPGGYDFWMAQLNAGRSRGSMMLEFSQSTEFVKSTGTLP